MGNPAFMEKFHVTVPREIDRINQLVEDLLELTRTRIRPRVDLNVDALILQVIDLHGEELKKRDIAFENHLERTLPPIQGDAETLYRAFTNLIINAIQAMPNGGILFISTELDPSSSSIKLTFKDTGIGMDEMTTKNIFNPFFTTKDKGAGLGLALTRKIIENHKGTIEVTSERGKGSLFVLKLPVAKV
jgi:signal transduction histidine kinase